MTTTIDDDYILDRYQVSQQLGRGAYGIVWKAVDNETRAAVAIKKCFDAFHSSADAQRTHRELQILIALGDHQNVVQLRDAVVADNEDDVYLVFGYMESDLQAAIQRGGLHDTHKRFVMCQLFRSLKYLHSAAIVHRDIKPANILINSNCDVRLCDFGMARSLPQQDLGRAEHLTDYIATRWYRAPEGLLKDKSYGTGFDIWSAGCVHGEMLKGRPLFSGSSTVDQLDMVMEFVGWPSDPDTVLSVFAVRMLESLPCMRTKPGPRPLTDMLPSADPDALGLLQQCLCFNTWKRIEASAALFHPYLLQFSDPAFEQQCERRIEFNEGFVLTTREYLAAIHDGVRLLRESRQRNANLAVIENPPPPSQAAENHTQVDAGQSASRRYSTGPMSVAAERVAAAIADTQMAGAGPLKLSGQLGVFFSFSEAAVGLAHQLFLWADDNRNRRLERSEFVRLHETFSAVFADQVENASSANVASSDFQAVDCDQNEIIDEAEWMQYMAALWEIVGAVKFANLKKVLSMPRPTAPVAPSVSGRFGFCPRPRVVFETCHMAVCQCHRLYQAVHGARPGAHPLVSWADFEQCVMMPEAPFFDGKHGDDVAREARPEAVHWLSQADEGLWMAELGQVFERIGSHRFLKKIDQIVEVLAVYADAGMQSVCSTSRSNLLSERLHF